MVLRVIGGLLIAFGTIWLLQGLGLLRWPPGSFMLGEGIWAAVGTLAMLGGAALLALSNRRRR